MTPFELYYRKFESLPQIHQLSTKFTSIIEEVFENLRTEDIYMKTFHSIIEPIFHQSSGNKFQHHNGPTQRQHIHKTPFNSTKKNSKQYQPRPC